MTYKRRTFYLDIAVDREWNSLVFARSRSLDFAGEAVLDRIYTLTGLRCNFSCHAKLILAGAIYDNT